MQATVSTRLFLPKSVARALRAFLMIAYLLPAACAEAPKEGVKGAGAPVALQVREAQVALIRTHDLRVKDWAARLVAHRALWAAAWAPNASSVLAPATRTGDAALLRLMTETEVDFDRTFLDTEIASLRSAALEHFQLAQSSQDPERARLLTDVSSREYLDLDQALALQINLQRSPGSAPVGSCLFLQSESAPRLKR
jgi:hypothetical protein